MVFQQTIADSIKFKGVGLHSGREVNMRINPASADTGIVFRRTDFDLPVEVAATSDFDDEATLATVLGKNGVEVSTVEHCMAALAGMGVDNAVIELDGPEVPVLDGSAAPYVRAIKKVGLCQQNSKRAFIRLKKVIRVEVDGKFCILMPSDRFRITYGIEFDNRFSPDQHFYLDLNPASFASELAPARTFGFLEDVEYLRSIGKAKGGSLDNAVVLHGGDVLNPEGLRMSDEFVRHKILDAVGDLALAGMPIMGHLIVYKGGHALHEQLVKALLSRTDAFEVDYFSEKEALCWMPPRSSAVQTAANFMS